MNNYEKFVDSHHQDTPLLLGNVWDVRGVMGKILLKLQITLTNYPV
jgi:hypothetical protein